MACEVYFSKAKQIRLKNKKPPVSPAAYVAGL